MAERNLTDMVERIGTDIVVELKKLNETMESLLEHGVEYVEAQESPVTPDEE